MVTYLLTPILKTSSPKNIFIILIIVEPFLYDMASKICSISLGCPIGIDIC